MNEASDAAAYAEPLARSSGAHMVWERLRARIISLDLPPHTRLRERDVTREYEVSRTPVREAFRMLLSEGLLEQQPTGGILVAPLDPRDMEDVYSLRAMIESLLVRCVVERATSAELAEIGALPDRMSLLAHDDAESRRLGRQLHEMILAAARNRHAASMLHRIQGQLDRYRALGDHRSDRRPHVLEEHMEICRAVSAGDGEAAARAVYQHAMAGYDAAISALPQGTSEKEA